MTRQVILLAIKLHHRRPRRQRHPIVRRRRRNPPLHQRRHIHRHISPGLAHRNHLRRTSQRRQRRKRNAVLPPPPIHRLHAHQPARIRAIAIQPQRSPRHLRRRSPRRQCRKIKLQQRRIPATHIQIRNRPAIHRRPRAVHMSICHQRRLHRKRRQACSRHRRKPHPKQKSLSNQAHPVPQGRPSPRQTLRTKDLSKPSTI